MEIKDHAKNFPNAPRTCSVVCITEVAFYWLVDFIGTSSVIVVAEVVLY